jgi:hypothetical protein
VTDWRADVEGLALAAGQRLLVAGDRDWPMLEIRELECAGAEDAEGDEGVAGESEDGPGLAHGDTGTGN